jgi:replication-associated recombination protein RarA
MEQPNLIPTGPTDMRLRTIRGYDFSEVSSAMQKAIRRGDTQLAGYWALELWASGFGNYVWKRLLTISAEDCWGIITAEVKALHDGYLVVNANISARHSRGRIFISKAVILLSQAKKSRDADHLQNLVYDQCQGVDADQLADELRSAPEYVPIPEYAYDCHTRRGKKAGKTKADFFVAEHAALHPFQPGLFDHLVDV